MRPDQRWSRAMARAWHTRDGQPCPTSCEACRAVIARAWHGHGALLPGMARRGPSIGRDGGWSVGGSAVHNHSNRSAMRLKRPRRAGRIIVSRARLTSLDRSVAGANTTQHA